MFTTTFEVTNFEHKKQRGSSVQNSNLVLKYLVRFSSWVYRQTFLNRHARKNERDFRASFYLLVEKKWRHHKLQMENKRPGMPKGTGVVGNTPFLNYISLPSSV